MCILLNNLESTEIIIVQTSNHFVFEFCLLFVSLQHCDFFRLYLIYMVHVLLSYIHSLDELVCPTSVLHSLKAWMSCLLAWMVITVVLFVVVLQD